MSRLSAVAVACVWAALVAGHAAHASPVRVLDSFDDISAWKAIASDDVQASVHPAHGVHGRALRIDFDLAGTAGYALARRALPLTLPDNYEITFYVRAEEIGRASCRESV